MKVTMNGHGDMVLSMREGPPQDVCGPGPFKAFDPKFDISFTPKEHRQVVIQTEDGTEFVIKELPPGVGGIEITKKTGGVSAYYKKDGGNLQVV